MTNKNLSLELKKKFPSTEWAWLLVALRQDEWVWDALENTNLGQEALETLPAQTSAWSPAALCLLALGNPSLLAELRQTPLKPLEEELFHQASRFYEAWVAPTADQQVVSSLAEVGLLALTFREQYRLNNSWQEPLQTVLPGQKATKTLFACLYGMMPDSMDLMRVLCQQEEGKGWIELALHAFLCNPNPAALQVGLLTSLCHQLRPPVYLELLQALAAIRPTIASILAQELLRNSKGLRSAEQAEKDNRELLSQMENLGHSLRLAQAHEIAGQSDLAVPILADGLRAMRRLRGHLSARLARSVAQSQIANGEEDDETAREASLEAWKQAVLLAPDDPRYAAGLGYGLLKAGRPADGRAYLDSYLAVKENPTHPEIFLANAILADQMGDKSAAVESALKAFELVETGLMLPETEVAFLVKLLVTQNAYEQAYKLTCLALTKYPTNGNLLSLLAKIQYLEGKPEQAITTAYATRAAEEYSTGMGENQPSVVFKGDEFLFSLPEQIDADEIRMLLVESLESVNAWEAAFDERQAMIAEQANPSNEDLNALARCATGAEKYEQAVKICQRILSSNPNDLMAHSLLAEAAGELQDYSTALEHYNLVVQMAPDQARFWKSLVKIQKMAGQEAAAFDTLRAASQALPEDGEIQLSLGEYYLAQGAPTLALPCFRRAANSVESASNPERIALLLGQTLHELGRLEEAREILEQFFANEKTNTGQSSNIQDEGSVRKNPELAHLYARTLLKLGEPARAIPILTQVVRYQPEEPEPCLDLAKALLHLSEQSSGAKRAIPFLQRILGITPEGSEGGYVPRLASNPGLRAEARSLLAEAYAAIGDWSKALEAYRKAMEDPANLAKEKQARLSVGLGLVALKLDQPEMAVAALQEAAQTEPLSSRIQRSLSEAYLASSLTQDSFLAAKSALELAPTDIDTLSWFIGQGLRISERPEIAQQPVFEEVVGALRTALRQAPERADFLIRLGDLLFRLGANSEALEVFRKLAETDTAAQKISVGELHKAAKTSQEAGDARLAITLLRKAIDQLEQAPEQMDETKEGLGLSDLYLALVGAFERLGDPESALEALEQALCLDKNRIELHALRADLLLRMQKGEAASEGLEAALLQWPGDVGLRLRMGRVLQTLGKLPQALSHVEQGIVALEEEQDSSLRREIYELAAKLAFATLRPRRAFAYLQSAIPETAPEYSNFEQALLRAELALEAGENDAAEQALSILEDQGADTLRVQAVGSRLATRRGRREEADKKCRSASLIWEKMQVNWRGQIPSSKAEFMAEFLAIGQAKLENRQWKEALDVYRQLAEIVPEEPLAHYKLANALMVCAEAQALCQDLEIVNHAPGEECLLNAAWEEFESHLRDAAALAGNAEILKSDGILDEWDVELKRSLILCERRGRAVFHPSLQNAQALEYLLQTIIPEAEDIAALIMAYQRCNERELARKSIQVGWRPVFDGDDHRTNPLVITQLALSEDDPNKAIEILQQVLQEGTCSVGCWPEPPMLQFLLSRFHYQAGSYPAALAAIQEALADWPDEPRWQAHAAKIYLVQESPNRLQALANAINYLEQASTLEPEYSSHHLALGQVYLESGQVQRALQSLEQASHLKPENAEGWFNLAKAQYLAGDLEQAALSAERAIEQMEEPVDALMLRAEIALETNNYRGALSRAQAILRLIPDQPKALYLLAKALEGLNRPAEALEALEKALPLFDQPVEMTLERLQLIKRSQSLEAGMRALQELISQNPKQADYLALLAEWLLEAGKQDAAMQAARLALQDGMEGLSRKKRADLHTLIGLHMRRTGQLDQAIHHLSEAITQSSDHLDAYLELGKVYQERRELQQALKVYQKAINMAGGDYRPYYQAGLVLKDNKDYMAAEAMLRRAAQLAPDEVSVHRLLGAVVALNLVHSHRLVATQSKES